MAELTVLMTVYDGMPYLPLAIESILNQSFRDFEFLIVNDCSKDETRNVVLSYDDPRIRLVDNKENIGQTRSLNVGLEHTRTELVARMDADDVSHPTRLETQVAFLEAHPDVVAVGTHLRFIDINGRVIGKLVRPQRNLPIRWMQLFECPISGGAVMFRKSVVWDELGGFDPSIRFSQDYELWSRIPPHYELANIPQTLYDVRSHPVAATFAMRGEIVLEKQRIYRANPRCILGIVDDSAEWLRRVDLLPEGALQAHQEPPDLLLEVIETLFKRFCTLYPAAIDDRVVLDLLSTQYFRAVECSRLCSLSTSLRALRLAWRITPKLRYMVKLLRSAAILAGGRKIKAWYRSTTQNLLRSFL